jgi:hypothetical protein
MKLLENIKKYHLLIFLFLVMYMIHIKLNNTKKIENMTNIDKEDIKKLIYETYKIDVQAIKNLSTIAVALQKDGLILPGNGNVKGKLDVGGEFVCNENIVTLGNLVSKSDIVGKAWITAAGTITSGGEMNAVGKITSGGEINAVGKITSGGEIIANSNIHSKGYIEGRQNKARYIRIGNTDLSIANKLYWTLIEVRAYDQFGNNVALGKTVNYGNLVPITEYDNFGTIKSSPLYNNTTFSFGNPSNITDGKIFTDNPSRVDHGVTGTNDGLYEFEIDLVYEYPLYQIQLFNRYIIGGYNERLSGTVIKLLSSNRVVNRVINTGLWHNIMSKEYTL